MKKIFAIAVILALFVFGLTVGASAADTPTRTSYLDLPAQSPEGSTTEGWTWTVDGSNGTLTLNNLYLQAPSLVNGVKPMVAFPSEVTDVHIILQGSNIIQKTDMWQCDIFAAAGKKVTISGNGSLEFRSADKNSTLVNCDSLVMEDGTISMADNCQAGHLFHTQNALTINGGNMTFKSTYGIQSEKGPVSISGGDIKLNMVNAGFGIWSGPSGAVDVSTLANPGIVISGGTIHTNGSIKASHMRGLSITGGTITAEKEVGGDLFYADSTVRLPENFSTGQLSTINAPLLKIPEGKTLEIPGSAHIFTNNLANAGTLNNHGRVTIRSGYDGSGAITGGGLIDFKPGRWNDVVSHAENIIFNRCLSDPTSEQGYCYVYGNAAWNSGWSYTPKTMYIPKGGQLTVPSGADIQVSGPITIHGADSLTGQGTVTSTAGKYYIEYSEDSLTPPEEMDVTYDGTNLQEKVFAEATKRTPPCQVLNKVFALGGDLNGGAIRVFYSGSSYCQAGEQYIQYTYDPGISTTLVYTHRFNVKPLAVSNDNMTLEKRTVMYRYNGEPQEFAVAFMTLKHNGVTIAISGNFDVSYSNNVDVGEANITLTANGKNMTGTLTTTFTISPRDLWGSDFSLQESVEKTYDGTTSAEDVLTLTRNRILPQDEGKVGLSYEAVFDSAGVGEDKTVTVQKIRLTGEKASYYSLYNSTLGQPSISESLTTTGKITPAPLSVTVTGKDKPYDGNTAAQVEVEFTGLQHGETLTASDYTVTAAFDSPGAGANKPITGTVTLNATAAANNYTLSDGAFQTTASITKAGLTLSAPTAAAIEYGQTLADSQLSGGSAKNGEQTVEGAWSWAEPQARPLEDGSYTVKFIPEDGANYATGETQVAVSVTPAQPKITISAPSRQQAGRTATVAVQVVNSHDPDLTEGLPVPTVSYKIGDGEFASLVNGELLIPEDTQEGTVITIKAVTTEASGKYTAGESTFTITVVDKAPVSLSGIVLEDKTYDGQPAAYSGTPTAVDESGNPVDGLTYAYQWKDSEGNNLTEAPKNAGSYSLTISAESGDHMGEMTFPITIAKRLLTWDVSGLCASKPQNSQKEAAVYGELRLIGVVNDEVALHVSSGLTTEGLAGTKEPGNYSVSVRGTWTFDPADPENYELPGGSDLPTLSARVTPVQELDVPPESTPDKQLKLEMETGISTVPAALLANQDLNTPAKLEKAMKLAVTEANSAVAKENTAVYDVSLMVSEDGGKNWTPATRDNFPAEGRLTVTLPYPEGTGQNTHDFVVIHMFTTDDFGKTPGETERPAVTKTAEGIRFTVTGLSPVSLGWVKKSSGGSGGGGGWYPPVSYYSVKVDKTVHGTVTASPTSIYSGGTVTLTLKPDEGYKLDKITVTDSQNKTVELTEKDDKFTFKMPGRDVTVKADFVPIQTPTPSPGPTDSPSPTPTGSPTPTPTTSPSQSPEPWKNPFPDVSDTGWYIKAVEFVCKNGLMSGYANGRFGPNDSLTRAQFAQIIYNNEGRPKSGSGRFSDVTTGWYANAVNWAAAEGIVAGVGGGKFAPDLPITRQDLAVMLWRYAGNPEPRKNELDFSDAGKVSTYAWKALCWAHESGIVSGKGNGVLDPRGNATRAEAAQMVMKFVNNL